MYTITYIWIHMAGRQMHKPLLHGNGVSLNFASDNFAKARENYFSP